MLPRVQVVLQLDLIVPRCLEGGDEDFVDVSGTVATGLIKEDLNALAPATPPGFLVKKSPNRELLTRINVAASTIRAKTNRALLDEVPRGRSC